MMVSVSGLFLTGLILELGGEAFHVGMLQTAMLLGGVFQIGTNFVLTRIGSRKRFCLITLGTVRVLRLLIAALPLLILLGVDRSRLIWPLGGLLLLGGICGMSAEVARQSWIADLVPAALRGRFFGYRVAIGGIAAMVVTLLYGGFVDAWKAAGHEAVGAFQILIAFGAGAGFVSLLCVWLTPEPPMHRTARPATFGESVRLPLRHPRFRGFVILHGSYSFAVGFCGGFFHLFMLQFLGMRYSWIAATDVLSQLLSVTGAPLWGRLADRWGTKRMLTLALIAKGVFPFLWLGLMPQWWHLVFAVVLVRMFNSATQIGWINLALELSPEENRAAYISMYRSVSNLARAISPFLAGLIAAAMADRVWAVGPLPVTSLHVLFVISGVLRLGSLVWLRKVAKPLRPIPAEPTGQPLAEDADIAAQEN